MTDGETRGLMIKTSSAILDSLSKLNADKFKSLNESKEIKDEFERIVQYLAVVSIDASLNP